jgi:hypothetical protein
MRLLRMIENNFRRLWRGELAFHLEMRVCNAFNRLLGLHPVSSPFLSGDTYRSFADLEIYEVDDIKKMKCGCIIFLPVEKLSNFQETILPKINTKFSMITHRGDKSVTSNYLKIADHPHLVHWFAQNNQLEHPKITAIPIGLEDAWRHNNGVVKDFVKLRKKGGNKIPRVLYGFNVNTNRLVRSKATDVLCQFELADSIHVDSRKYRKILNEYMFVASPAGNGIDCHRTWEALYLGTIPIVVGKSFYSQFDDFPGVILDDWEEIRAFDQEMLIKIYKEKKTLLDKTPYIWDDYWRNVIKNN